MMVVDEFWIFFDLAATQNKRTKQEKGVSTVSASESVG